MRCCLNVVIITAPTLLPHLTIIINGIVTFSPIQHFNSNVLFCKVQCRKKKKTLSEVSTKPKVMQGCSTGSNDCKSLVNLGFNANVPRGSLMSEHHLSSNVDEYYPSKWCKVICTLYVQLQYLIFVLSNRNSMLSFFLVFREFNTLMKLSFACSCFKGVGGEGDDLSLHNLNPDGPFWKGNIMQF